MREPASGELQIVVYVDDRSPLTIWIRAATIDARLKTVETTRSFGDDAKRDVETQMGGRLYVYDLLTSPDAESALSSHLASEILWLAVNHYAQDTEIRRAIDEALSQLGHAVMSIAITSPDGMQPGTHWSVAVGTKPHDFKRVFRPVKNGSLQFFGQVTG